MLPLHGKYERDINRALRRYALIPVAILLLVSYAAVLFGFTQAVSIKTNDVMENIGQDLAEVCTKYIQQAELLSQDSSLKEAFESGSSTVPIYQKLYSFVNQQQIRWAFYVLDINGRMVLSSQKPQSLYSSNEGFLQRALRDSNNCMLSVEGSNQHFLSVSHIVLDEGTPLGIVLFEMDESCFQQLLRTRESVDLILTNQYNQVCWSTNDTCIDRYGKVDNLFRTKEGLVTYNGARYIVRKQRLLNDELVLIAVSSFGAYSRLFIILGYFLIIVFVVLLISILFSSRVLARKKTAAIDALARGIQFVQAGDFDHPVTIRTGDELQDIADSYNNMLNDIKRLMHDNEQKAYLTATSELKQLEAQFNPHFIFNTLDVIRFNLYLAPQTVENSIVDLSSILRYSITAKSFVTLEEDMRYLESYFRIQSLRFNERIQTSIAVDDRAYQCLVPKLVIQPIIENAFKYGFQDKKNFKVSISVTIESALLNIRISNNGVPISEEQLDSIRAVLNNENNINTYSGLYGVHRRIQLLYGLQYGLSIKSEPELTVIQLTMPVNTEGSSNV